MTLTDTHLVLLSAAARHQDHLLPRPDHIRGRAADAGRMHQVTVVADGFAWNGSTYSSLSEIAYVITGTRWSGPRFFGLRDKCARAKTAGEGA